MLSVGGGGGESSSEEIYELKSGGINRYFLSAEKAEWE